MLLSEILGVERDVEFRVEMYGVSTFKVSLNDDDIECLMIKICDYEWKFALAGTVFRVISLAPAGIIHLPPPLMEEQREQLKALYTLGYRWLAKDSDGIVYSYGDSKPEKWRYHWIPACREMYKIHEQMPESIVKSLVSWSDPEPYDIGKALGWKNE